MKILAVMSGIGLLILWLVGLGSPGAATWLTWLNGVAGILCFVAAGAARNRTTAAGSPMGVAVGLFVLWIVGLLTNGAPFQNWWTFAFACLMLVASFVGGAESKRLRTEAGTPVDTRAANEPERFRKSA